MAMGLYGSDYVTAADAPAATPLDGNWFMVEAVSGDVIFAAGCEIGGAGDPPQAGEKVLHGNSRFYQLTRLVLDATSADARLYREGV